MAAKKKLKREKKVLVFDENSRRDYLLGFRKRKNERRKKAIDDLTKKEKDRRKELKHEKKKSMADQMEKHRKELEALESDDENEQEAVTSVDATYDHPEHVVTVTTISDVNLDTEEFACIGPNRGLMETVNLQPDTSLSEKQNNNPPAKGIEKATSKQQKTHKKFKRKRINKKSDQQQDGRSGKSKKRKQLHPHGKSKHFKKS